MHDGHFWRGTAWVARRLGVSTQTARRWLREDAAREGVEVIERTDSIGRVHRYVRVDNFALGGESETASVSSSKFLKHKQRKRKRRG